MSFCLGVHAWYAIWQQIQLQGNTQRRQSELFASCLHVIRKARLPLRPLAARLGQKICGLASKRLVIVTKMACQTRKASQNQGLRWQLCSSLPLSVRSWLCSLVIWARVPGYGHVLSKKIKNFRYLAYFLKKRQKICIFLTYWQIFPIFP